MITRIDKTVKDRKIYKDKDGNIIYRKVLYEVLRVEYKDSIKKNLSMDSLQDIIEYISCLYGTDVSFHFSGIIFANQSHKFEGYPETQYLAILVKISQLIENDKVISTSVHICHETDDFRNELENRKSVIYETINMEDLKDYSDPKYDE